MHTDREDAISHYGIGFLACFMLSDKVIVRTKHYSDSQAYELELEKDSKFVTLKKITKSNIGTDIVLDYSDFMSVFDDEDNHKKSDAACVLDYIGDVIIAPDISLTCQDHNRVRKAVPVTKRFPRMCKKDNYQLIYDKDPEVLQNMEVMIGLNPALLQSGSYINGIFDGRITNKNGGYFRSTRRRYKRTNYYLVYRASEFALLNPNNVSVIAAKNKYLETYVIDIASNQVDQETQIIVFTDERFDIKTDGMNDATMQKQPKKAKELMSSAIKYCQVTDHEESKTTIAHSNDRYLAYNRSIYYVIRTGKSVEYLFLKGMRLGNKYSYMVRYETPDTKHEFGDRLDITTLIHVTKQELYPTVNRVSLKYEDSDSIQEALTIYICWAIYKNLDHSDIRQVYALMLLHLLDENQENEYINCDAIRAYIEKTSGKL